MKKLMWTLTVMLLLRVAPLQSQTVKVGDPAPNFTGTTIQGKYFSLHETVQDSIVVIFFMGYS